MLINNFTSILLLALYLILCLITITILCFLFSFNYWVQYVFFPINISNFYFSSSKKNLQLLVPIKFSTTIFCPYFKINFCIF